MAADSQVEVKMMLRDDKTVFFDVRVQSVLAMHRGSKHWSSVTVEAAQDRMEYRIAVAAGAAAEYLNVKYGEAHDPEACARTAEEAYREIIKEYSRRQ